MDRGLHPQDECSFVSLRDIERAMIVFEYFLDKMHIFGPKIVEKAAKRQPRWMQAGASGDDDGDGEEEEFSSSSEPEEMAVGVIQDLYM